MTGWEGKPDATEPDGGGYWLHQKWAGATVLVCLLASIGVARWLPYSEFARSVASLVGLTLIPLLIGSASLRWSPLERNISRLPDAARALVEWLCGSLLLVAIAVALALAGQTQVLQQIGWLALALAGAGQTTCLALEHRRARLRLDLALVVAVGAAVLVAVTPKILAAQTTPFPLVGSNVLDPLYFAQPAARLLDHGYLTLENGSHPPGIIVLTAVQAQLYEVQPLAFLWTGSFMLLATFGAGMLLWVRAISGRWTTALLTTTLAVFLLARSTVFGGAPLAFRSNQLLFAALPLAFYLVHHLVDDPATPRRAKAEALIALQAVVGVLFVIMSSVNMEARVPVMLCIAVLSGATVMAANQRRWRWGGMSGLFVVIVAFQAFHVFMAPVFLTATILYGLALTMRGLRFEQGVATAVCASVAGFVLLQHTGVLIFPPDFSISTSVFGDTYQSMSFSAAQRIQLLDTILSPMLIAFLLLGSLAFLTRRAGPSCRAALITGALMVAVYLLPDTFAYRTNKAMMPFLAVIAVAGADAIGSLIRDLVKRVGSDRPVIQEFAQLGLAAAMLPALLVPFLNDVTTLPLGKTNNSVIDQVDYELAGWFSQHTDENARIISDYQTMLVLPALSDKVSVAERRYLPSEMTDAGRAEMSYIKDELLRADDGCAAYTAARALRGDEPPREQRYLDAVGDDHAQPSYYVVWTAKTFTWAGHDHGIQPVRTMLGDVYPSMVQPLLDSRFFELEAVLGAEAYVFRVRDVPAAQPPSVDSGASAVVSDVLGVSAPPGPQCALNS